MAHTDNLLGNGNARADRFFAFSLAKEEVGDLMLRKVSQSERERPQYFFFELSSDARWTLGVGQKQPEALLFKGFLITLVCYKYCRSPNRIVLKSDQRLVRLVE